MEPTPPEFEVFKGDDEQFYWRLKSHNGQVIATGGEGYTTHAGAIRAIDGVQKAVNAITVAQASAANEDAAKRAESEAVPQS